MAQFINNADIRPAAASGLATVSTASIPNGNVTLARNTGVEAFQSGLNAQAEQERRVKENENKAFDEMLKNPSQAEIIAKQYGIDYTPQINELFKNPALAEKVISAGKIIDAMNIKNPETSNVFIKKYLDTNGDVNAAQQAISGLPFEAPKAVRGGGGRSSYGGGGYSGVDDTIATDMPPAPNGAPAPDGAPAEPKLTPVRGSRGAYVFQQGKQVMKDQYGNLVLKDLEAPAKKWYDNPKIPFADREMIKAAEKTAAGGDVIALNRYEKLLRQYAPIIEQQNAAPSPNAQAQQAVPATQASTANQTPSAQAEPSLNNVSAPKVNRVLTNFETGMPEGYMDQPKAKTIIGKAPAPAQNPSKDFDMRKYLGE